MITQLWATVQFAWSHPPTVMNDDVHFELRPSFGTDTIYVQHHMALLRFLWLIMLTDEHRVFALNIRAIPVARRMEGSFD